MGAVSADVGVGVDLAGRAVGGPAGVTDAAGPLQGFPVVGFFGQVLQFAGGLDDFGQVIAAVVDELDAVVVVGIVAGGNHDTAVEIVHSGNVGHAGCSGDVEQIGVRTRRHQATHQRILKHIAGAAGILSDHDAGRIVVPVALPQHPIIPAQKAADLVCVVCGEFYVGFPTEAVGTEVFAHCKFPH